MTRHRPRLAASCAVALALALSLGLAPPSGAQQAAASPGAGTQPDGWRNLVKYLTCAVNIASAIQRGDNWQTSGAWLYCAHLMAEERE